MQLANAAWVEEALAWHVLKGADATRVLQNLSTQDLAAWAPGQSGLAAFVDHKGQMLDLWQAARTEEGWVAWGEAERLEATMAWVDRHVITEDVVHEAQLAKAYRLVGPPAEAWARQLALGPLGREAQGLPQAALLPQAPEALAWALPDGGGLAFLAWGPAQEEALELALRNEGWEGMGPEQAQAWRVAHGRPSWVSELQGHNPWECRLDQAVALSKGCYLGQEVVARLHHYAKVSRGLVGFSGQGAPPEAGAKLSTQDGKAAGSLSSVVASASGWQALGFLSASAEGQTLHCEGQAVSWGDRPFWEGQAEGLSVRAAGLLGAKSTAP